MIMASAGTGKTYNLAMRYLQLLSFGINPSEILAVTFTKKAAGEIFDKIINRLLDMTSDKENFCSMVPKDKLTDILKKLLTCPNDLRISTIDSFFSSLVRAYAPELGLSNDVKIIDAKDDRPARKVLRQWIKHTSKEEREELRELLKSVSEGKQLNFESSMIELLSSIYAVYLDTLYDNGKGICTWGVIHDFEQTLDAPDEQKLCRISAELRDFADTLSDAAKRRMLALADYISDVKRGNIPSDVIDLLGNFNEQNQENWLFDETTRLAYTKKIIFSEIISQNTRQAVRYILNQQIEKCRKKTLAVKSLIEKFDAIYSKEVRMRGSLTFDDQPLLLRNSEENGVFHLSSSEDMNMEERLDATINHYLFDEFQDTSNNQWYIFENLIDEILSSYDDRFRSLFCVGDIKQSIYQWRGGDPYLFGKVIAKAIPAAEHLGYDPREELFKSYRSSRHILDTANRVFEKENTPHVFQKSIDIMQYTPHESSNQELSGFTALINTPKLKKDDLAETQANIIVDTLRKISPFTGKKNLTVGVLVQKNDSPVIEKVKELCTDMPISIDGKIQIQNSMAFTVLRQLIMLSEHPSDPVADGVLKMLSDDAGELITAGDISRKLGYPESSACSTAELSAHIKHDIFKNSLAGFIQHFLDVYGEKFSNFDYERIDASRTLAETFSGTPEEFLHAIDKWHELKDQSVSHTIQFLTIHKSKGLEFDIVFLPDMYSKKYEASNKLELAHKTEIKNNIRWVNYFPQAELCRAIPALKKHWQLMDEDRLFEECCKFYVAMTRAKRAMYIFTNTKTPDELPYDEKSPDFQDIIVSKLAKHGNLTEAPELHETLGKYLGIVSSAMIYTAGSEDWHLLPFSPDEPQEDLKISVPKKDIVLHPSSKRRKLASQQHDFVYEVPAQNRFVPRKGANRGTVIHELFEQLDYIDDNFDAEKFAKDHNVESDAAELFASSLVSDSEIRRYLAKPSEPHLLWKERRFLFKDDTGEVIPGAFDRVTVYLDDAGNFRKAEILDYKSDDVETEKELLSRHHLQLKLYRKCLSRMTDIPEENIKLLLGALKFGKIVEVV